MIKSYTTNKNIEFLKNEQVFNTIKEIAVPVILKGIDKATANTRRQEIFENDYIFEEFFIFFSQFTDQYC